MSICKATVILGEHDICKDCVKADVCKHKANLDKYPNLDMSVEQCEYFKDRSKSVDLPCKVGDTVYYVYGSRIEDDKVHSIYVDCWNKLSIKLRWQREKTKLEDFGKTVFLKREEAEKALEERGEK